MNYTLRLNLLRIHGDAWEAEISAELLPGFSLSFSVNYFEKDGITRSLMARILPAPNMKGGYMTTTSGIFVKSAEEMQVKALLCDSSGKIVEETVQRYE